MAVKTAIIVGGGIIGLSCAVALQRRNIQTTVLNKDTVLTAPSWNNGGHIGVEQTMPLASPQGIAYGIRQILSPRAAVALPMRDWPVSIPFMLRLLRAALPKNVVQTEKALASLQAEVMGAWQQQCDDIGVPNLLRQNGHFEVWESANNARKGMAAKAANPWPSAAYTPAMGDEIAALQAFLGAPIAAGVRHIQSGQITDLLALRAALINAFKGAGGDFRSANAMHIARNQAQSSVVCEDDTHLKADAVIVASGVLSGALLAPLGHKVPIIAERGYHIEGVVPAWPQDTPPIIFADRALLVTRFAKRLRLVSFVELGRPDTPPDPNKWAQMRNHAHELGIEFQGEVSEWMGARPTLPDFLPAIGKSQHMENLYYAFGHQHLGLTLSAITAQIVADLVQQKTPKVDVTPFNIERFSRR